MDEKKSFGKRSAMTTRNKVVLIVMFVTVLLLGISCSHTIPNAGLSSMRFAGNDGMSAGVAVKDFEPLDIVYASATAKRGSSPDVYDLLLKEAQKLGAHGIINIHVNSQRNSRFSGEVTITASALAIKYTDLAGVPAPGTHFSPPVQNWFWRGFGDGF